MGKATRNNRQLNEARHYRMAELTRRRRVRNSWNSSQKHRRRCEALRLQADLWRALTAGMEADSATGYSSSLALPEPDLFTAAGVAAAQFGLGAADVRVIERRYKNTAPRQVSQ